MLISIEHEFPTLPLNGDLALLPHVFEELWREFSEEGWEHKGRFGVSRLPQSFSVDAIGAEQALSTDTGPTIEMAPSPAETVGEIDAQLAGLRRVVAKKLSSRGAALLGSGIHPRLGTSEEEYYRYRTPRAPYDYAISREYGRGWEHRALLNIAAIQEVIDIPVDRSPAILGVMHRLAGVFLFIFRNDPDYHNLASGRFSVRPYAWKWQVGTGRFPEDRHKVGLPETEVATWPAYLRLLWDTNPMFILGTKDSGLVYICDHPTFAQFITCVPKQGWQARRMETAGVVLITPEMAHVQDTDWGYMGFSRLRLFWRRETKLPELVNAYRSGSEPAISRFMAEHVEKVLLENRSSATSPPGSEMCSLALVVGLVENIDAVSELAQSLPYSFWLTLAAAAEYAPFDSHVGSLYVPSVAQKVLALARTGLVRRGYGEEGYLDGLERRVRDKKSVSEHMLALYRKKGIDAVIEKLRYSL